MAATSSTQVATEQVERLMEGYTSCCVSLDTEDVLATVLGSGTLNTQSLTSTKKSLLPLSPTDAGDAHTPSTNESGLPSSSNKDDADVFAVGSNAGMTGSRSWF